MEKKPSDSLYGSVQTLGLNRAVVEAESCGRCSPIVRSFPARREAAREGLCKAFGLLKKRFDVFIKRFRRFKEKNSTFFKKLEGEQAP